MHILVVIPATSVSAERSFSALRRLKIYFRKNMGQHSRLVRNPTLNNIEREYAKSVLNNDMDGIINIFGLCSG